MKQSHSVEHNLFIKWERYIQDKCPQHGFMFDGIVNQAAWNASKKHILFLLKDYNDSNPQSRIEAFKNLDLNQETRKGIFDLRCFLRDHVSEKGHWRVWDNIARWAYGLQQGLVAFNNEVDSQGNANNRKKIIGSIAVVDIKKSPGKSSCSKKQLDEYFRVYPFIPDFLTEQLNLYQELDYIVCCGDGVYTQFKKLPYGKPYIYEGDGFIITKEGIPVIKAHHPLLMGKNNLGKKGEYETSMIKKNRQSE
jgi:hypothetical protein